MRFNVKKKPKNDQICCICALTSLKNIDANIPLLKIEKQIKPLSIEIHVVCKIYRLEAY